jgi:hypothetical protein
MRIPTITADVPTEFDHHWSRQTSVSGRTYNAAATEFGAPGEATNRIALTVHQRDRLWALPSENSPYADNAFGISACVVSGSVSISIGDVSIYLPEGRETEVADALLAAIAEQARQADAGTEVCVVSITGDDPTGFRNSDAEVSA